MRAIGKQGTMAAMQKIIAWIILLLLLTFFVIMILPMINFDFFTDNSNRLIDEAAAGDPDLATLRSTGSPVPVGEYAPRVGTCEKVDTVAYEKYKATIESAVAGSGLASAIAGSGYDANALLAALITQESGVKWDPRAVSPCASAGIVQFIPATAMAHGLTVSVKRGQESFRFSNNDQYRTFVNKEGLWQDCNSNLCGTSVSPCNACTTQYCDYEKDDRFDPEKAIPAAAKYLAGQMRCGSVSKGVAAYNSGNCEGEANGGYTSNILTKWYPRWAACLEK